MSPILYFGGLILFFALIVLVAHINNKRILKKVESIDTSSVYEELNKFYNELSDAIDKLKVHHSSQFDSHSKTMATLAKAIKDTPAKTLNTIQGSVNNTTGKMGEMMQLIELQQIYDRLMVVGDIVDFIGIKFSTDDDPGSIDFIDVKTGKNAALSSNQRKLRNMIQSSEGIISFKEIKTVVT